jgi:hypothetical protein
VNRDSGTDSANGGWLRRLVRRQNPHNSYLLPLHLVNLGENSSYQNPKSRNDAKKTAGNSYDKKENCQQVIVAELLVAKLRNILKGVAANKTDRDHRERNVKNYPTRSFVSLDGF